ncbi:methylesterase 17 isoform X2 [Amborella trichopoda]|uniref:methylesterase 17 isoform X2 n=1 Tax=Amborella trichopoda TaxID=13333 RepID=UPI0005D38ABC|nr:methylesterase 17 isoform X2 [Amborella trichopoda]|eukprot:XP_011622677.1 methylesterase 17 isoform X2 [Amborella trichopoda]
MKQLKFLFLSITLFLSFFASNLPEICSHNIEENQSNKHFVLIHGACHGAWCWYKIASLLKNAGYKVSAVDLASAGINMGDADTIFTFEEYNKPLVDLISKIPENQKSITVLRKDLFHYWYALGPNKPPTSVIFRSEKQREMLSQLSPYEDSILASMLLRRAPFRAFADSGFEGQIEKVSTVYIKTKKDTVVSLELQEQIIRFLSPDEVMDVDSDHSPFFSKPNELFALLVKASATYCGEDQ